MAYHELIKNFEKIRAYIREFYVYGFKSRTEYNAKSARSYDDERRRIESWLGDYMRFSQTPEGKNVFLSIDSRVSQHNPLYKVWKTKSFTAGDITLHFILLDILASPDEKKTLAELAEQIDTYLRGFAHPMTFDESTIRKKLKEYVEEGIFRMEKAGRRMLYSRIPDTDLSGLTDIIDFFSEVAPCGVVGSFLQDRQAAHPSVFFFKHHYITQTMDSDVLALLFDAMHKKSAVTIDNLGKRSRQVRTIRLVPLRIYMSAQNGRQNLIAFHEKSGQFRSYRLDYISHVRLQGPCDHYDALRAAFAGVEGHMWGVNCKQNTKHLEHVEFDVRIAEDEQHIVHRLEREKRCGRVEQLDEHHYRFTADVFDTNEMLPWIRTFLSRITHINFSNQTAEQQFRADVQKMYELYGIGEETRDDLQ